MIRILILADAAADAEALLQHLRNARLQFTATHVTTESAFRRELVAGAPDVVLADFAVPGLDGFAALRIACELAPDLPFIFVSDSIGEERAVAALREGAVDYILSDRPQRLPSAIERAVSEHRGRAMRRRMQDSLRTSEQRFHLAAEATRDLIWDWTLATGQIVVNEAIRTEWLHDVGDEVTIAWYDDHIHAADRAARKAGVARALHSADGRISSSYRFLCGDGRYRHMLSRAIVVRGGGGVPVRIIGVTQDVSAIRNAIDALADAQHLTHLGSYVYDPKTDRFHASDEMHRIFGIPPDEQVTMAVYLSLVYPDDRQNVERNMASLPPRGETRELDHRIIRRDDGAVRVIFCRMALGEQGAIVGTVQDLTEWHRLKMQFEQSERIATLGRIAATMAHEFNNVLMAIQPFAEIVRMRGNGDQKLDRAAAHIMDAVARGRGVTQHILNVTNPPPAALRVVDAGAWLKDVGEELEAVVGNAVRVELPPAATEPLWVRCDPEQMQQVLTNLAINARDAMPGGGTLTITAATNGENGVRITISDTGSGISAEALPHIFEPLFTTKTTGTGIGLAVVHSLVAQNGGTVSVESGAGKGTTFIIELAAANAPASVAAVAVRNVNSPPVSEQSVVPLE